jgi:hypothetical protein
MKTALLIAGAGISCHGDQQCQSSKSAFQHHDYSLGEPERQRAGEPGVPGQCLLNGRAGTASGKGHAGLTAAIWRIQRSWRLPFKFLPWHTGI